MRELFKHTMGIFRVGAKYIQLNSSITRGHIKRLKIQRVHKFVRQNFLNLRATNIWNFLAQEVISAPTLNTFKVRLNKHWANFYFSPKSLKPKADGQCLARPLSADHIEKLHSNKFIKKKRNG